MLCFSLVFFLAHAAGDDFNFGKLLGESHTRHQLTTQMDWDNGISQAYDPYCAHPQPQPVRQYFLLDSHHQSSSTSHENDTISLLNTPLQILTSSSADKITQQHTTQNEENLKKTIERYSLSGGLNDFRLNPILIDQNNDRENTAKSSSSLSLQLNDQQKEPSIKPKATPINLDSDREKDIRIKLLNLENESHRLFFAIVYSWDRTLAALVNPNKYAELEKTKRKNLTDGPESEKALFKELFGDIQHGNPGAFDKIFMKCFPYENLNEKRLRSFSEETIKTIFNTKPINNENESPNPFIALTSAGRVIGLKSYLSNFSKRKDIKNKENQDSLIDQSSARAVRKRNRAALLSRQKNLQTPIQGILPPIQGILQERHIIDLSQDNESLPISVGHTSNRKSSNPSLKEKHLSADGAAPSSKKSKKKRTNPQQQYSFLDETPEVVTAMPQAPVSFSSSNTSNVPQQQYSFFDETPEVVTAMPQAPASFSSRNTSNVPPQQYSFLDETPEVVTAMPQAPVSFSSSNTSNVPPQQYSFLDETPEVVIAMPQAPVSFSSSNTSNVPQQQYSFFDETGGLVTAVLQAPVSFSSSNTSSASQQQYSFFDETGGLVTAVLQAPASSSSSNTLAVHKENKQKFTVTEEVWHDVLGKTTKFTNVQSTSFK